MQKYQLSNGNTLQVINDESPESPRTWSNLTKMVCFHRRYSLGDKHKYRQSDHNSWDELKAAILKNEDVAVIEPMYMLDHSNITVSITPISRYQVWAKCRSAARCTTWYRLKRAG